MAVGRLKAPDQVEWFASLEKDQAGFIQDWWDEHGERSYAVGDTHKAGYLMDMFGHMTEHECQAMYEYWGETGRHTYEADVEHA